MQGSDENKETGRLAGLGAGAVTGAQLGTMLIPIPIVGTFTGAVVGGALGSRLGERLVPAVLDTISSVVQPKTQAASESQPRASSIPITTTGAEQAGSSDLLARLERLGALRSQGLLTEEEFAAAKAVLLNQ